MEKSEEFCQHKNCSQGNFLYSKLPGKNCLTVLDLESDPQFVENSSSYFEYAKTKERFLSSVACK